MIKSSYFPGQADIIVVSVMLACLALWGAALAINGMIDLGAAAHDAFCPAHGWIIR